MKRNRILASLCAAAMLLPLAACGGKKNSESQSSGSVTSISTAETEKEVSESVTETSESEDTSDSAEPIVADETDIPEQTTASTTIATATAETTTTTATTTTQAPTAELEPVEQPSEVGVRDEVKDALDSYEALMNEYCDFMEKYSASPNDLTLLMEYSDFLTKYTDAMDKLSALDNIELNDEETKYYLEVTNRVSARLIEAAY